MMHADGEKVIRFGNKKATGTIPVALLIKKRPGQPERLCVLCGPLNGH
jgi:hypothetical protein